MRTLVLLLFALATQACSTPGPTAVAPRQKALPIAHLPQHTGPLTQAPQDLAKVAQTAEVLTLPWGQAPGQVGQHRDVEAMAEGPNALDVAADGRIAVLDQVNGRVQVFAPGQPPMQIPLQRDSFEDVAWGDDGRLFALDRVGHGEIVALTGGATINVPLQGPRLDEPGGATALFPGLDGVWLEVEHGPLVHVTDADGHLLDPQPEMPGRLSQDGRRVLTARILAERQVEVLARTTALQPVFRRVLDLPLDVLGVRELGGLRDGRTVLVVAQVRKQDDDVLEERLTALVLDPAGQAQRRLELPPPLRPWEQFRPVRLGGDGALYVLQCGEAGAAVLRFVP